MLRIHQYNDKIMSLPLTGCDEYRIGYWHWRKQYVSGFEISDCTHSSQR